MGVVGRGGGEFVNSVSPNNGAEYKYGNIIACPTIVLASAMGIEGKVVSGCIPKVGQGICECMTAQFGVN